MLTLGTHTLTNTCALAPMAGVSDVPFRKIAWQCGAGYVVGEMVSAKAELWHTTKSRLRRIIPEEISPVAIQLAGNDPAELAEAAARHVGEGAQIIDLNFGCPAKKVCRKAAGSALLNDTDLVFRIVESVARAVCVPVTVKTRTGWSPDVKNGVEVALGVARAGASALVIHGRTRACRFNGQAEHTTVGEIVAAFAQRQIRVPVLANGDIDSAARAQQVICDTGVSGVMIGRAAVGAPWLLGEIAGRPAPDTATKWQIVLQHLDLMHSFYGEQSGVRIARKHLAAYLHQLGFGSMVRAMNRIEEASSQARFVAGIANRDPQTVAA